MSEEQRTFARNVVKWIMGVPVVLGGGFVGYTFWNRNYRTRDGVEGVR